MIAEKRKLFFSFLLNPYRNQTLMCFHVKDPAWIFVHQTKHLILGPKGLSSRQNMTAIRHFLVILPAA